MSTGAVFASFTDKSDLFTEIAETEQAELDAAMRAAAERSERPRRRSSPCSTPPPSGTWRELALFQADHERALDAGPRPNRRAGGSTAARRRADRRRAAAPRSADAGAADVASVAEMIWDGYVALIRRAALDGLTPEAVKARMRDQVETDPRRRPAQVGRRRPCGRRRRRSRERDDFRLT